MNFEVSIGEKGSDGYRTVTTNYYFYLHFYIDQDGEAKCSQWTNQTWEEYLNSTYIKFTQELNEDNPITLIETQRKIV